MCSARELTCAGNKSWHLEPELSRSNAGCSSITLASIFLWHCSITHHTYWTYYMILYDTIYIYIYIYIYILYPTSSHFLNSGLLHLKMWFLWGSRLIVPFQQPDRRACIRLLCKAARKKQGTKKLLHVSY